MEQPSQFSLTGAGVTLIGQAVVLPETIPPTLRMILSIAGAFAVGVLVPGLQRLGRDYIEARLRVREVERERDEARDELARLRSGQTLLGPPTRPEA